MKILAWVLDSTLKWDFAYNFNIFHLFCDPCPVVDNQCLSRMSLDEFHEIDVLSNSLSLEASIMIYDLVIFFYTNSEKNNLYFYDGDNLTLEGAIVSQLRSTK